MKYEIMSEKISTAKFREAVESYLVRNPSSFSTCCQHVFREGGSGISELLLYHIWQERHFDARNLATTENHSIEILDWGVRNHSTGPDFRDTIIKINGRVRRGDVEMHLKSRDWYGHGHHLDPNYNRVVLHVVMWHHSHSPRSKKMNGRIAPILLIHDFLDKSLQDLRDHLNSLYQFAHYPCQKKIADSSEGCAVFCDKLIVLGEKRFLQKLEKFQKLYAESGSWDHAAYQGIARAMGYSKNSEPFEKLARFVPYHKLQTWLKDQPNKSISHLTLTLQSILLGASGLLISPSGTNEKFSYDKETLKYLGKMESIWKAWKRRFPTASLSAEEWTFSGIRPANYPTRRIAALSSILTNFLPEDLLSAMIKPIIDQSDPDAVIAKFYDEFHIPATGFWQYHYRFRERVHGDANVEKKSADRGLLGKSRIQEIMVNVVFPLILSYARHIDDAPLKTRVWDIVRSMKTRGDNRILRGFFKLWGCGSRVPADHENQEFLKKVVVQQGLIRLHKKICQLKQCEQCPLI
ncbi:MAG: hypothetical protein B6244_01050 [Candidatus Cloacimonetes bacterium 4572_55]|nr:MAG: hypothetical protein B6244_01050 [Candidatus Cloacimonetes bacterium 4572_55]